MKRGPLSQNAIRLTDTANLTTQLQVLCTNLDGDVSLNDVVEYLQELPKACRSLFSEVITLVKLILVMPASNSTCERSFSALRRIKTYLRSTMSQVRLNNLMVLHVHWDRVDKLDLCQIANEFIDARDFRRSIFLADLSDLAYSNIIPVHRHLNFITYKQEYNY